MRKKGKLELPIYPTLPDIGAPEIVEVTSLTDTCRQFVASTNPGVSLSYTGPFGESKTIHYPSTLWEPYATTLDYADLMEKIGKKEEAEVKISSKGSVNRNEHIVYCEDALDLSTEKILTRYIIRFYRRFTGAKRPLSLTRILTGIITVG